MYKICSIFLKIVFEVHYRQADGAEGQRVEDNCAVQIICTYPSFLSDIASTQFELQTFDSHSEIRQWWARRQRDRGQSMDDKTYDHCYNGRGTTSPCWNASFHIVQSAKKYHAIVYLCLIPVCVLKTFLWQANQSSNINTDATERVHLMQDAKKSGCILRRFMDANENSFTLT